MLKHIAITILFLLFPVSLFSQDITLYKSFLGKYDFTMVGNTLNTISNGAPGSPCTILTSSAAQINLDPNWNLQAAYLYWGGSGGTYNFDFNIKLNGQPVEAERTFLNDIASRPISGAFADVTDIVMAQGNGTYTVSDFDLTNVISSYCSNATNFGGWSILIIYEDESLPNNLVNVYDGFVRVDQYNQYVSFTLDNLDILNLSGNKVGFLAWEGDYNIAVNESLRINGNLVSNPPLNPGNNVFNETNSFTNSSNLYNMDMDFFDINSYTNVGDNSMTVSLQSGQDAVIIHNIVLTLNSELPDAIININSTSNPCDTKELTVEYTVTNVPEATAKLPGNTPIAFFADDILIGTDTTSNIIPIGGSQTRTIVLTIPDNIPDDFTLLADVNNDGTGNRPVHEFDDSNNTDEKLISMGLSPEIHPYDEILTACDTNNDGSEIFDLTVVGFQMLGQEEPDNIRYYLNAADANAGNNNFIPNPTSFANTVNPQTIYVRLKGTGDCYAVEEFQIEVTEAEALTQSLDDLFQCAGSDSVTGLIFDLTQNTDNVLGANDPESYSVSYHLNQEAAMSGTNPINNPEAYSNISAPQTVWARLTNPEGCVYYGSFELDIAPPQPISHEIPDVLECSPGQSPVGIIFDLTQNTAGILDGADPDTVELSFYLTEEWAINGINPILNPTEFSNTTNPQTIWVRIQDEEGCITYGSFIIGLAPAEELPYSIPNLSSCSPDLTLTGVPFNLTQNNAAVLNGNSANLFTVSYYLDANSATQGINPIENPEAYENIASPQTIWTTLISQSGCIEFSSFEIEVTPISEVDYEISNMEYCAEGQEYTGNLTDLTQNEEAVLNGQNPALFTITYHSNMNDAINGTNIIPNPQNYTNLNVPEIIWVRITDSDNCVQYGSFIIDYELAPLAMPVSATLCSYDGTVAVYLPEINPLLIIDTEGLSFHYYMSQNNAENDVNPLPDNYTFTQFPITIYARVISELGCYTVAPVTLNAEINRTTIHDIYRECDSPWEPGDGFTQFDLTSRENTINQQLGLNNSNISYYRNLPDAEQGINAIPNPQNYTNQTNPQTIYARAEGIGDECGGIAEFIIETLPVPEFILDSSAEYCFSDSEKPFEFEGDFDTYTWFDPNGNIAGNSPQINFEISGTYVLEVTQTGFGCPAKREINVIFEPPPLITGIDIQGNTATVHVHSDFGPFTYSYNNGLSWQDHSTFGDIPHGYYEIIVMSRNGCISAPYRFAILNIPNVITPNGDGINDYWEIRGIELYPNSHVQLFDRYGKLFLDRPLTADFRWDGTYKGDPVPSGTYWYIITMENGQKISGHLTVKRLN